MTSTFDDGDSMAAVPRLTPTNSTEGEPAHPLMQKVAAASSAGHIDFVYLIMPSPPVL